MISIIIPTYKPGKYIFECLKSIKNQTLSPEAFEIILILNGEKEPYYSRIQDYADKNLKGYNYKLIYSLEKGVSNARNLGIDNSRGEYITFIDDDDIVSTNFLEELLKISSSECVGCSNSFSFDLYGPEVRIKNFLSKHYDNCKGREFSFFRYRGFLSPPWAKLFHRNIIGDTRFRPNLAFSEDSVFCFELSPKIKNMRLSEDDNCIYFLRLRQGSSTRNKFRIGFELSQWAKVQIAIIENVLKKPGKYNAGYVLSRMIGVTRNVYGHYKSAMAQDEII